MTHIDRQNIPEKIEAETFPELSQKYDVASVPSFKIWKSAKVVESVVGFNPPALAQAVMRVSNASSGVTVTSQPQKEGESLEEKLKKLVSYAPVMLFMKGTPAEPKCGFSRKIVDLLKDSKIKFSSFDILGDSEVREGLKKIFEWPTFPQLYVGGKLVGGLDVVTQMKEEGELLDQIPESHKTI